MNALRFHLMTLSFLLLLVPITVSAQDDPVADAWLDGADADALYQDVERPARDLRVQLWHDHADDDRPYRRGEKVDLSFRTNGDAYVVVYRIDVDGYVDVLWPTSRYDDGFVYGSHDYVLPRPGHPKGLRVGDAEGVEYVQTIASQVPFDLRGLAIDFYFDTAARENHGYRISGDPFLAVNDINYAITGLEEDVDYVVTDWSHLYVDQKVDYARYTCTQCHDGSGSDDVASTYTVRPYRDTCTTVNVYSDWGWQRRWYVDFGWYPLYYEPTYYYWDAYYGRSYWFSYYPVYYSWPVYPVYARPYKWYRWHDSNWYRGDFRVRYARGNHKVHRLYDFDAPERRTRYKRGVDGRLGSRPTSLVRARGDRDRIARSDLVRDRAPTRTRTEFESNRDARRIDRSRTTGLRTDRGIRTDRRLTALESERRTTRGRAEMDRSGAARPRVDRDTSRSGASRERTERRWTRPVIRNDRDDRARTRSDRREVERERPTRQSEPRRQVERERPTRRSEPRREVERDRSPRRSEPRREVERDRSPRRSEPRREVQRDRPTRRSEPRREVDRGRSRPSRQEARPQRSAPTRRSDPGNRGGGSTRSRTKKNGGGGRG